MAEIVVADAGPLIAFGQLRRIELLPGVFEKIVVPGAVFEETQFHPDLPDARAIVSARESGLFVVENSPPDLGRLPPDAEEELGEGEAAAIALAAERGHGVLIDEKLGRAVAEGLKLKVIGTVGVLLIAQAHFRVGESPMLRIVVAAVVVFIAGMLFVAYEAGNAGRK